MLKRNGALFYLLSISFLGQFRKQRIARAQINRRNGGADSGWFGFWRSSCALLTNVGLAATNTVVCPGMYPALNAMGNLGGKWKELP